MEHCNNHSAVCEKIGKLEGSKIDGAKYVTYKWLIATAISIAGCIILVVFSLSSAFDTKLKEKANREAYDILYATVMEIKNTLKDVEKNQVRIMTEMNIKPIKKAGPGDGN